MPSLDTLAVSAGLAGALREAFSDHRLDVVLTNDPMDDVDGIVRHPLLSEPYILLVPRVLPAGAQETDLRSLSRTLNLIRWSAASHIGADIERHLRRLRVDVPRHFEFDSSDTMTGIVAAGLGWAVMTPLCLLNSIARQGAARAVPFPGAPFSRTLYLISREGELDRVCQRMARISRRILKERYLAGMLRIAPWLRNQIVIGNPKNAD
jgi:DNA-binding transcriptional LysR family regulator